MTQHSHHRHHADGEQVHHDESGLAELLDLDAALLGSYLDEVTEWAGQHAPDAPRTIVDVGAGTGVGSLALARRFEAADVVAIDRSALMVERMRAAAQEQGIAHRVRVVQADVDVALTELGAVDLVWASSSLHEFTDPDRVLRDVFAALNPGGLIVVVEMDALPGFLPDDIGMGEPGLEVRCHEGLARAGWNAHPDWGPHLERAGFEPAAQRSFPLEASASRSSRSDSSPAQPNPAQPNIGNYARAYLRHLRSALEGRLAADDLLAVDHLLTDDSPDAILHRSDLTVRGSRTAWAARRPSG